MPILNETWASADKETLVKIKLSTRMVMPGQNPIKRREFASESVVIKATATSHDTQSWAA